MPIRKRTEEVEETRSTGERIPVFYTREQLMVSEIYRNQRDLIAALLEDGKGYTKEQVDTKINDFRKGKVN